MSERGDPGPCARRRGVARRGVARRGGAAARDAARGAAGAAPRLLCHSPVPAMSGRRARPRQRRGARAAAHACGMCSPARRAAPRRAGGPRGGQPGTHPFENAAFEAKPRTAGASGHGRALRARRARPHATMARTRSRTVGCRRAGSHKVQAAGAPCAGAGARRTHEHRTWHLGSQAARNAAGAHSLRERWRAPHRAARCPAPRAAQRAAAAHHTSAALGRAPPPPCAQTPRRAAPPRAAREGGSRRVRARALRAAWRWRGPGRDTPEGRVRFSLSLRARPSRGARLEGRVHALESSRASARRTSLRARRRCGRSLERLGAALAGAAHDTCVREQNACRAPRGGAPLARPLARARGRAGAAPRSFSAAVLRRLARAAPGASSCPAPLCCRADAARARATYATSRAVLMTASLGH